MCDRLPTGAGWLAGRCYASADAEEEEDVGRRVDRQAVSGLGTYDWLSDTCTTERPSVRATRATTSSSAEARRQLYDPVGLLSVTSDVSKTRARSTHDARMSVLPVRHSCSVGDVFWRRPRSAVSKHGDLVSSSRPNQMRESATVCLGGNERCSSSGGGSCGVWRSDAADGQAARARSEPSSAVPLRPCRPPRPRAY